MNTLVVCHHCEKVNRVDLDRSKLKQPVCGHCQSELPIHSGVQEVTDATLQKLIQKSDRPVVVDFWAEWCGPCKMFAPTFKQVAQEYGDRFIFAKLDTESNETSARNYQIRGIPTLMVFRNGQEIKRQSGAMNASHFKEYLNGTI